MTLIRGLKVDTRHLMAGQIWTDVLAIGRGHDLSSYDAAYLFLVLQEGMPLATLDQGLRGAAEAAGAEIYAPV